VDGTPQEAEPQRQHAHPHLHLPHPDLHTPEVLTRGGWYEVARQFFLIFGAVLIYFGVRGLTEGNASAAVDRALGILRFEEAVGLDVELGLQRTFRGSRLLTTLANWVYIWLHWPVIAATLFWLHHRHRRDYYLLRNAMFISGALGLFVFALWPVAPPRLVGQGFVDTVTELSTSYRVLQPPALVNRYAAVPSLHVGWNLLVGVTLWRVARNPLLRLFAVCSPALMGLAVMATANHFLVDGIAGSAFALAGLGAATWLDRRSERRATAAVAGPLEQRQIVDDDPVDPVDSVRVVGPEQRVEPGRVGDPPGDDGAPPAQP
jgi:hypothetical protein